MPLRSCSLKLPIVKHSPFYLLVFQMKIKSKLKKLRDEFKLSHVLWFFTGILVTVAFNWIVYKDPKRITAPGVSTLVAMSTFMLALWSAFKVNKWLNSKVNDAAFNQSLKVLEQIEVLHEKIQPVMNSMNKIIHIEGLTKEDSANINDASMMINEIMVFGTSFFMKINTLRYWNIKFTDNAERLISELKKELMKLIRSSQSTIKFIEIEKFDNKKLLIEKITTSYFIISGKIEILTSLSYDEIFDKNSFTSPSKKVYPK